MSRRLMTSSPSSVSLALLAHPSSLHWSMDPSSMCNKDLADKNLTDDSSSSKASVASYLSHDALLSLSACSRRAGCKFLTAYSTPHLWFVWSHRPKVRAHLNCHVGMSSASLGCWSSVAPHHCFKEGTFELCLQRQSMCGQVVDLYEDGAYLLGRFSTFFICYLPEDLCNKSTPPSVLASV